MRAKALLTELIKKHPEWNWEDLEDQGFVEIMQAFRLSPEEDQNTVVLAYTVVKEYIRRFLDIEEQKRLKFFPQRMRYESRLYNSGFKAGIKELQIRSKEKKTRNERQYIEIADKFDIDIQTVILIWSLVNGYKQKQEQIIKWAKKQYPQSKLANHPEYYRWLSTFLEGLSPEDFTLFYGKYPDQVTLGKGMMRIDDKEVEVKSIEIVPRETDYVKINPKRVLRGKDNDNKKALEKPLVK